jgi:hypothetical protein
MRVVTARSSDDGAPSIERHSRESNMTEIPIITYGVLNEKTQRNPDANFLGPGSREPLMGASLSKISAETLQSSFKELVDALGRTLTIPDAVGAFQVEALDIQLEVTAEGKIGLLGNGAKVGGKGSLTLRLKRLEKLSAKVGKR